MGLKRSIKNSMDDIVKQYPILAITGPRQSGKTTFLKNEFSDYRYVNMENPDMRNFALNDPKSFLAEYDKYVIFDEVQRVPFLFSYLQTIVDDSGMMGQFILSGSQNFHLMRNITQSLAGRVAIFKLFPFDFHELKTGNLLNQDWAFNAQKGFYPAIYDRNIPSKVFYNNYIQTYIERDLTDLLHVKDLRLFRNFISLCAGRVGGLLNLNELAKDCGISQPTAKAWMTVLEMSYITFQLQPYHSHLDKRVIKTPKLYFYDTGLLCHLLKMKDVRDIMHSSKKGAIFENMVISEYVKMNYHHHQLRELWFWRDAVGHEVDLIWQDDEKLNLVEIKATATIMSDLFKGLEYFDKILPMPVKTKTLLYSGLENQKRSNATVQSWIDIS